LAEEKEFFIYEDIENIDVDYVSKETPKETIVGVPTIKDSTKPVKKAKVEEKPVKSAPVKEDLPVKEEKPVEREKTPVKEDLPVKEEKPVEEKVSAIFDKKPEIEERIIDEPKTFSEPEDKPNILTILLAIIGIFLIVVVIFYVKEGFQKETIGEGAAIVNGEVISLQELNENYDLVPESYKVFVTKEQILDQLIEQRLVLQEAESQGIAATQTDIDKAIEEVLEQNLLTMEQFEEMAIERGLTIPEIRDSYEKQLIVQKLLDKEIKSQIDVKEEDIRAHYDNMIRASHILVQSESAADSIMEQLLAGVSFEELATQNSEDTGSAAKGGDLGEFSKGQMVEEFEQAAFELEIGETSDIIQTDYGYHIIKRTERTLSYEATKDRIKDILGAPQQQELYAQYVKDLRNKGDVMVYLESEIPNEEIPEPSIPDEPSIEEPVIPEEPVISDSCYANFGVSSDTVVYYYADWCVGQTQCDTSKAAVDSLSSQGYNIHVVSIGADILECFNLENKNLVPQFICAGSSEARVGSMTESNLERFAEKCVAS